MLRYSIVLFAGGGTRLGASDFGEGVSIPGIDDKNLGRRTILRSIPGMLTPSPKIWDRPTGFGSWSPLPNR